MRKLVPIMKMFSGAVLAAAVISGCGGAGAYGGSGSGGYGGPAPHPSPTNSPQSNLPLQTAMLNGSPGFINAANFTVYVFDADLGVPGQSACNGTCAQNWPPFITNATTFPANYASITRQDGGKQLTYKGRPLYTFSFDTAPGQANGDGVNAFGGLWHIARP